MDSDAWVKALRRGDPRAVHALDRLLKDMSTRELTLSKKQTKTLQLMADLGSNWRVAEWQGVSEESVKSSVKWILLKLNAKNRTHAVAIGIRAGLIK